jgi:hypothetical protein
MKAKRIVPLTMLRPTNISEFNWQVWTEYQSGMFKFEIGTKHFLKVEEVSSIIENVISSIKDKKHTIYPMEEFTSWKSAQQFRELIREKFYKAPVINGNKIIMSEL